MEQCFFSERETSISRFRTVSSAFEEIWPREQTRESERGRIFG